MSLNVKQICETDMPVSIRLFLDFPQQFFQDSRRQEFVSFFLSIRTFIESGCRSYDWNPCHGKKMECYNTHLAGQ